MSNHDPCAQTHSLTHSLTHAQTYIHTYIYIYRYIYIYIERERERERDREREGGRRTIEHMHEEHIALNERQTETYLHTTHNTKPRETDIE